MRFAANLSLMFTEAPFPQRFEAAARAGFTAVEFQFAYDYAPQDIKHWLDEQRLECVLFNMPPGDFSGGDRGLASIPGREGEFRDSVVRALEYAEVLGTPRLHALAGILPVDADRNRHRDVYLRNLEFAARALAERGLTLLIEPINPRDIPGFFLNSQSEAHAIRQQLGQPNLKVLMDFYHAQIVDGDLATTFRKYQDGIGHVQIAGVPGRHEPDVGEIRYEYLFELLDELNYAGWVGCEYRPKGRTEEGLGWFKAWR